MLLIILFIINYDCFSFQNVLSSWIMQQQYDWIYNNNYIFALSIQSVCTRFEVYWVSILVFEFAVNDEIILFIHLAEKIVHKCLLKIRIFQLKGISQEPADNLLFRQNVDTKIIWAHCFVDEKCLCIISSDRWLIVYRRKQYIRSLKYLV